MYLCKVNVPEWIKLEEYSPVVDNILFSVYILYCRSPVQFRMGRQGNRSELPTHPPPPPPQTLN